MGERHPSEYEFPATDHKPGLYGPKLFRCPHKDFFQNSSLRLPIEKVNFQDARP